MSQAAVVRPPKVDVVLLSVAVLAVSTSGPLIAACAAPALAIAFWRCILGAGATLPVALRSTTRTSSRDWRLMGVAGLLLGAHFAAWVPSLRFTSVASATALVATQPVWAVLIARGRGARVPRQVWAGIAVALVGVVVVTGIDFSLEPRALVGDGLALLGAVFMAANVTVGQHVRQRVPTSTYTATTYGVAGLALLIACGAAQVPLGGYPARDWWLIVALTLIAQLVGHTLINRVLATTPATVTSLAILFEVPGSILIAALWLQQVPPPSIVPALVLLVSGLVIVVLAGDPRTATEDPPV